MDGRLSSRAPIGDIGETLWETTGFLEAGRYEFDNNGFWRVDGDFDVATGQSGSGVWLSYLNLGASSQEFYLAGVISNNIGSTNGVAGPAPDLSTNIDPLGDHYIQLASYLQIQGYDLSTFQTNVLVADQDGFRTRIVPNPVDSINLPPTAVTERNDFVQGTGFNEDIYIDSTVGITVDGGGGFDTVVYAPLSGGINFLQGPNSISALRDKGAIDTLSNIDHVIGSVFADTFQINNFLLNQSLETIIGNSLVPSTPQQGIPSNNGNLFESADGGRNFSAAELIADSGLLDVTTGNEDTIFVSQDLLDAGAQVTYLTTQGEGVIWLETGGVTQRITYTGIFNEADRLSSLQVCQRGQRLT